MKKTLVNSQLCNFNTYQMYLRRMLLLAENVFKINNLPEEIDLSYFNSTLLRQGSIAFFKDEILGVIALPYSVIGSPDIYGRPREIMARAFNGRYFKKLKKDEFVIMYDNTGRYSMYLDILQCSERIALSKRTIDVNIVQQRTPRIWKTTSDKKRTIEDLSNNIDGFRENVLAYDSIDIEDMQCVLAPAPYVADKVDVHLEKEWAEFYSMIGISSTQVVKKERMIKDEVNNSQGGTIASRFARFESRKRAIEQINKKWGLDLSCEYYDGIPSMIKEVEEDVSMDSITNSISEDTN